jgi:hypothetical protein
MSSKSTAEQVVMACVEAINREDFQTRGDTSATTFHSLVFWVHGKAQMRISTTWSGFVSNTM